MNKFTKIFLSIVPTLFFMLFCFLIMFLTVRGIHGNPTTESINNPRWKDDGPFELSPERGRFALTMSIAENNSFYFSLPVARFATPDLGYKNGKYVSLFAPGVSFLVIPGYLLGRELGAAQMGTFAIISLFAIVNAVLIRKIAVMLGANSLAASIGALTFLFATPAFAYGVSLYQHHISTFLILVSVFLLLRFENIKVLFALWFLCAASVVIDYPNVIFMIPIALFAFSRIFFITTENNKYIVNFRFLAVVTFITAFLPLIFFVWFNKNTYDNPLQLSGTVRAVQAIDENGNPASSSVTENSSNREVIPEKQDRSAVAYFNTRNLLNGFYIQFLSPDRGILWFTPIMLFSVLGFWYLFKRNSKILTLLVAIAGANILLYAMWGDPWGGWAFGSRYLIPSYAILSIILCFFIMSIHKKTLWLLVFLIVLSYSVAINTVGALTSSRNPPQVEILGLEKQTGRVEKYTFERNFDFLRDQGSKSYVYQRYFSKNINGFSYYVIVTGMIVGVSSILLVYFRFSKKKDLLYE